MTGYAKEEVLGRNCRFLQGEQTDPKTVASIRASVEAGVPFQGDILNYRKDGRSFWNALTITPITDQGGVVTQFVSVQRDVTAQKYLHDETFRSLQEAEHQRETARLLLEAARTLSEGSSVASVAQTVADIVPFTCSADCSLVAFGDYRTSSLLLAGFSGWDESIFSNVDKFTSPEITDPHLLEVRESDAPVVMTADSSLWAARVLKLFTATAFSAVPIRSKGKVHGVLTARWRDAVPTADVQETLKDRMTGLAGLAAVAFDNAHLLERLEWNADHDLLTGLPNRSLIDRILAEAIKRTFGSTDRVGVVFCDVDRFKRANDLLGHRAGDQVLCEVARRVESAVGATSTVARIGGDEFVVVAPLRDADDRLSILVKRINESLGSPIEINGKKLFVTVSTGTASTDTQQDRDLDATEIADALINEADLDMYAAKGRARGRIPYARRPDDIGLETDLHGAVGRGEISAAYQPQIDIKTGRVVAVEALARWNHPVLGSIMPSVFISIAEESGLIDELGRFIMETACTFAAEWRGKGVHLEVAVNVSALQLGSPDFYAHAWECIRVNGLSADQLTLEITESHAVTDLDFVREQLTKLRAKGIGISVDDFGTGYSSLAHLHKFPVSEMKIDPSCNASAPWRPNWSARSPHCRVTSRSESSPRVSRHVINGT